MRNIMLAACLTGSAAMLSACGSSGIFNRDRPDEFAVSRQAPLVIPPDFAMQPPRPGAPRPQSESASQQALDAMFGGPQERSQSESQVIRSASERGNADPAIRSELGDPQTETSAKGSLTRDIVSAPEGDGQDAQASIPQ